MQQPAEGLLAAARADKRRRKGAAERGRSESESLNTEETQRGIKSQCRRAPKGVRALGGRGGDPGESGIQDSGHDEQEYEENHKLPEAGGTRPSWSPCSRRRKRGAGRRGRHVRDKCLKVCGSPGLAQIACATAPCACLPGTAAGKH